ncbi:MAG: hypothetical protein FJ395_08655 [Verrucomicrobia bacterium]|nr:hypothetical protein [Verrucomicrobiota bacterium]
MNRRQFVSACAACAASTTCGSLGANESKPKVRLVFCETPNDKPIWPNIGYDFEKRRKQITSLLARECREVEFLPVCLMNDPIQADEVIKADAEVDGYLLCVQGLGWRNDITKLSATGKPTLIVDNLFGGSGLFLTRLPKIMSTGKPVDWVSSSKDADIAASARQFVVAVKENSAASFRAMRRKNTPAMRNWSCKSDDVPMPDMDAALKELKKTRLLVVGGGWGGDAFRKASREVTGVEFIPVKFEEMAAAYEKAGTKPPKEFAERWAGKAQKIEAVTPETIEKCGVMYVAMKQLLDKHQARGISINCLGGFYGGHLKAYPCLGFCQLNDDGMVGGCEADQMSALTMAVMGVLTGRPGYISDPVIDTAKNAIVYAHCVAMTKPFGPKGASNPYQILTHSEDRQGAAVRSLLPSGYMTTTLEINPQTREVLFHQAKTIGNNFSDMACRTKLEAAVKGDLEKLTETWGFGWHRVTFYGDLKPHVEELCRRLNLKLVEEA